MSGPPPTPTKILKMRGSWRGDINKAEPQPKRIRPIKPKWLTQEAGKMWRKLVPMLENMGILAEVDGNALARYCDAWIRWRKAAKWLADKGEAYPIKDEQGNLRFFRPWPQTSVYRDMNKILSRFEGEFGLTPSARSRISVPEAQAKDDGKERFFGKGG